MITTAPLRVRSAATVVCLRRAAPARAPPPELRRGEATGGRPARADAGGDGPARLALVFGGGETAAFDSGWEVLMGQNEVQNWLRSSPSNDVPMRYPGEWKFPGGIIDAGETPEMAARRELQEELLLRLPEEAGACRLHLLSIKQTRPIRNVSNIMYNFVAVADENEWLRRYDVAATNAALEERRRRFRAALADGSFWELSPEAREHAAPEVRRVEWLDMRSAVLHSFTSMNEPLVPIDSFQAEEFARLGLRRRDPMFLTMATLLEVDSFPSAASLARHARALRPAEELRRIQWLFDGMSPEEVAETWREHASPTEKGRAPMFRTADERLALREARAREDREHTARARL